jgi:hypothetical protein
LTGQEAKQKRDEPGEDAHATTDGSGNHSDDTQVYSLHSELLLEFAKLEPIFDSGLADLSPR